MKQELVFRETDKPIPEFDGHHLQVYAQEFSGPHDELEKRGLITEESDQYQYRWQDIACLETGKHLFTIEHEVRSVTHPLYNRHMVNRNPSQNNRHYQMGADEWDWTRPRSTKKIQPARRLRSRRRHWPSAAPAAWPRCKIGYFGRLDPVPMIARAGSAPHR